MAVGAGDGVGPGEERCCLPLHQLHASLLVVGIKRVEVRRRAAAPADGPPALPRAARLCAPPDTPPCRALRAAALLPQGRSWPTRHRGTFWIASTARKPSELEVATVAQACAQLAARQGEPPPTLPAANPTSALLGAARLAECVDAAEYARRCAAGADGGAGAEQNDSPFLILVEQPRALPVPLAHSGHHKIYRIDARVASDAAAALLPPAGAAGTT